MFCTGAVAGPVGLGLDGCKGPGFGRAPRGHQFGPGPLCFCGAGLRGLDVLGPVDPENRGRTQNAASLVGVRKTRDFDGDFILAFRDDTRLRDRHRTRDAIFKHPDQGLANLLELLSGDGLARLIRRLDQIGQADTALNIEAQAIAGGLINKTREDGKSDHE